MPAKDTVTQDALRAKPSLAAEKLEWLKKHDRDCGDWYGMMPLVHWMPMALADHIDGIEDKIVEGESRLRPFMGLAC